jgi:hypothetical protein
MEQENQFTGEESLKLINEMIGKAKHSYVSKGIASMVWGTLMVICSMATWAQIQYHFNIGFNVWWLLFVAVIPQIYFSIRERKQRNFVGHHTATMGYVWTTFGICIFILSFYSGKFHQSDPGGNITSLYMMLYGVPTFITGGIFNFKPMIIGGLICWALAVASMWTGISSDMLMIATCGLFAWLLPGIIVWKRYKKNAAC